MIGAITGVLASRGNVYEYFTSTLYPFVVEDTLQVGVARLEEGIMWEMPNDNLSISVPILPTGTLIPTIVYQVYNNPIAAEPMTVNVATLQSGTLIPTIVYQVYNNPIAAEPMTVNVATLQSGTLVKIIDYVTYNDGLPESMAVSVATLQGGTLI